jgi:hypothetical protein
MTLRIAYGRFARSLYERMKMSTGARRGSGGAGAVRGVLSTAVIVWWMIQVLYRHDYVTGLGLDASGEGAGTCV